MMVQNSCPVTENKMEDEERQQKCEKSTTTAPLHDCTKSKDDEDDLDTLLDDALEDFDKKTSSNVTAKPTNSIDDSLKNSIHASGNNPDNDPLYDALWNDNAFMNMSDGLNDVLEQMSKDDPAMMAEFKKFKDTISVNDTDEADVDPQTPLNIDENVHRTLDELTKNLQGLNTGDNEGGFEDMLKQMQDEIGGDGSMKDGDMFMNMMQGMMTNLLSKELLYPSLKEIKDRYPSWFAENKDKISSADLAKYTKQQDIVNKLCCLFEEETNGESESVKKERMDKIMPLMQMMQECGHPPPDMMDHITDEPGGAAQGIPPTPECCIM